MVPKNQQLIHLDIALLHYPVLNKSGATIGAAVTNLDLHDIARVARTYGVENFFVVSPYRDQTELINEIIDHWLTGYGSTYNPARKEALSLIRTDNDLPAVMERIKNQRGHRPYLAATSARRHERELSFAELRKRLQQEATPVLLVFGTAHGIATEIIEMADGILEPIPGRTDGYNHLSVRSAVSIILDRLLGIECTRNLTTNHY